MTMPDEDIDLDLTGPQPVQKVSLDPPIEITVVNLEIFKPTNISPQIDRVKFTGIVNSFSYHTNIAYTHMLSDLVGKLSKKDRHGDSKTYLIPLDIRKSRKKHIFNFDFDYA